MRLRGSSAKGAAGGGEEEENEQAEVAEFQYFLGVGNLSLGGFRQSSLWSNHFPLSFAIHIEPWTVVADGEVFKVETL